MRPLNPQDQAALLRLQETRQALLERRDEALLDPSRQRRSRRLRELYRSMALLERSEQLWRERKGIKIEIPTFF